MIDEGASADVLSIMDTGKEVVRIYALSWLMDSMSGLTSVLDKAENARRMLKDWTLRIE